MVELKCKDYGFECNFVANGETDDVVEKFKNHNDEVHGIDYAKETIMQFVLRKQV